MENNLNYIAVVSEMIYQFVGRLTIQFQCTMCCGLSCENHILHFFDIYPLVSQFIKHAGKDADTM